MKGRETEMMTLEMPRVRRSEPRESALAEEGVARLEQPASTMPRAERRAQFEQEALVHLDALYSFALKLTRSRDEAEDLVSDTMLRAFDRWEQYHLGTNVRAWLFTILYHAFVNRTRRLDVREVQLPEDENGWSAYEAV